MWLDQVPYTYGLRKILLLESNACKWEIPEEKECDGVDMHASLIFESRLWNTVVIAVIAQHMPCGI